ncbi:response regulator [Methanofollis fontis]|uniref:Response regulatory domain-containing protein n=1 Tax=Methanofollis fontis TaxID=2052832 RepID=A0A483CPV8_9EURY|nr:response regulator [Methanofollis fontis]TAJ44128.1 hypothetical protein CUJ86_08850 [Methanofollis fontis]
MKGSKILVVEDEAIVAMALEDTLISLGYTVAGSVRTGHDAIQKAGETRPDLILMDIRLDGDMDGVEAAGRIYARFCIPVIYLTAHSDEKTLERAMQTQPYGYLIKPFRQRELYAAIEMAIHKHRIRQKTRPAPVSRAEKKLVEEVKEVKESGATPIIRGIDLPISVVSPEYALTSWNRSFEGLCRAFGAPLPSAGTPIYRYDPPEVFGTSGEYGEVFTNRQGRVRRLTVERRGVPFHLQISRRPVIEDGKVTAVVSVYQDMSYEASLKYAVVSCSQSLEGLVDTLSSLSDENASVGMPNSAILDRYIEDVICAVSRLDIERMGIGQIDTAGAVWEQKMEEG